MSQPSDILNIEHARFSSYISLGDYAPSINLLIVPKSDINLSDTC